MLGSLSIVVPAYNEAESIEATLDDALAVGAQVTPDLEVIVCNDGSVDGTGGIVLARAGADERVRLIDRMRNRGI